MKFRLLFAPLLAGLIAGLAYLLGAAVCGPWRPASISQAAWDQGFGFGGMVLGIFVANRWVRNKKNQQS